MSTHTGASLLQGNIFGKGWAGSAQNPTFGREDEYRIVPTIRPKKIVVVGGGSGGMEYAITAKEIGHDVVLFEKSETLGGAMDWAGNYPHVPNMEMLRYQPAYHRRMMEKWGVEARLGIEATVESILAERPDVVVIATGAEPQLPEIDGLADARERGFVLTIDQVLSRGAPKRPGKNVIVWGAGEGAELAIDLKRGGHSVRLLDANAEYAPANYVGSRALAIANLLAKSDLTIESNLKLMKLPPPDAAVFQGPGGAEVKLRADTVIITQGRRPSNGLVKALGDQKVVVQVVGDARRPRSYANAIHEAAYLVRGI